MRRLAWAAIGLGGVALAGAWSALDPNAVDRLLALAAPPDDARGVAVFAAAVLAASLVSEDLTCVGVGLLIAAGRVGAATGLAAATFALWAGDLLLYAAGRLFGARFLASRGVDSARLHRAGPWLILASRFVPGARLPTYVGAGVARYPLGAFAFWLALGAALWTPVLVGSSAALGGIAFDRSRALPIAAAIALLVLVAARVAPPLATWRGRRLWIGAWRRFRRWEFWPSWRLYLGVVPAIAASALRHRSLRVVTAVNPSMPAGGLLGESKHAILAALATAAPDRVARFRLVPRGPLEVRIAAVRAFQHEIGAAFPIALKPDVGERGAGVTIARSEAEVAAHLEAHPSDQIAQAYVAGVELGVFWVRPPGALRGRIVSITEKRMIEVRGDGVATLETLILRDERAVCLAPTHLAAHAAHLAEVPAVGARVALVELGTHSRGALFLDGRALETPALFEAIDAVSRAIPGFHFGRYDLRGESIEAIQAGRFAIVELNGLTSEPTHVYDPRHDVRYARRVLRAQWRLAFAIGAANAAAGAPVATWREIASLWRARRDARA